MNRKILLFGVDDNQQEKIKSFCSSFSVEVSPVEKKDCNQTIGSLAGIPKAKNTFGRMSRGKTASTGKAAEANCDMPAFSEPMMVFCNLEQEVLNQYLEGYSGAGIEKIALKAVLTPQKHVHRLPASHLHRCLPVGYSDFQSSPSKGRMYG